MDKNAHKIDERIWQFQNQFKINDFQMKSLTHSLLIKVTEAICKYKMLLQQEGYSKISIDEAIAQIISPTTIISAGLSPSAQPCSHSAQFPEPIYLIKQYLSSYRNISAALTELLVTLQYQTALLTEDIKNRGEQESLPDAKRERGKKQSKQQKKQKKVKRDGKRAIDEIKRNVSKQFQDELSIDTLQNLTKITELSHFLEQKLIPELYSLKNQMSDSTAILSL